MGNHQSCLKQGGSKCIQLAAGMEMLPRALAEMLDKQLNSFPETAPVTTQCFLAPSSPPLAINVSLQPYWA